MTRHEFRLPDIGEGTVEAECVAWHVAVGDRVEEDQLLLEVMTDKATVEVTSPVDGTVLERIGETGGMLPVGTVILVFDTGAIAAQLPVGAGEPVFGVGHAALEAAGSEPAVVRVLTTPAARRRAKEAGVDLRAVHGSGPHGRVRSIDLERYLEGASVAAALEAPNPQPPSGPACAAVPSLAGDEYDEIAVVGLRRKIAERMQDTKRRIPHFSYIEEVDVTQLEQLRGQLNEAFAERRGRLTLLPFIIRALAVALPEFPHLNARFDDEAGIVRHYRALHAGIATQTDKGLVVTVARNAEQQTLWGLAESIARLSDLARSGQARSSDLSGSTFTLSSLGAMGGLATTPVINSPEVAIIGINKILSRPIVVGERFAVAKMMNLSSSFDHRVVDGWDAAKFIQRMKVLLESPGRLLIG